MGCSIIDALHRQVRETAAETEANRWQAANEGQHVPTPVGCRRSALKAVAIVGMTANHAGYLFAPTSFLSGRHACSSDWAASRFPSWPSCWSRDTARTSNVKRYAFRLGAFALVSQIPYGLFLDDNGNVLFTLLIGLGVLYADESICTAAARSGP